MILDEIAAKTKERVAEQKKKVPLEEMKRQALDIVARETDNGSSPYSKFPFRDNLAADGISFICEVKKASPSKGLIAPDFPMLRSQRNMRRRELQPYRCSLSHFISREAISS